MWLRSYGKGASPHTGCYNILVPKKETTVQQLHHLPVDFKKALADDPRARAIWEDITPLAKNEWICWVISAKRADTRARRIAAGIDKLRKGMRRPCCWAGCPHR